MVDLRSLGGGGPAYPTCVAHAPASKDEFDTAVGLSTGEGELLPIASGCFVFWCVGRAAINA